MNLPRNFTSIHAIPEFCSANCLIKDVNKTGLGSSAAMITALVSSLLGYIINQFFFFINFFFINNAILYSFYCNILVTLK